jgi:beta-phosphoglucomutase
VPLVNWGLSVLSLISETRAALWDMDGTLIDSEEFHWRAWLDTMTSEGIAVTREQFLSTFGLRNDAIIPRWLGSASDPERVVRIGDAKEAMYRELVRAKGMSPLPGVERWVRRLNKNGWRQAIASSAPRLNVEVVLDATGLAACFQAIVSAEDVRHGKPDPEVFLTAASRVGVPPERCVVVEDAAAGIEAARSAGMRSIGVSRGNTLPADVSVQSLDLLPEDAFEKFVPF